ncbi:COG1470 family protein [Streptomyces sp. AC154]|uniref:COG1470 family protein n=1 Tax=Streptomyces sp. AC154 TaxID=3143184 RepID=UPI003F815812
MPPLTGHLTRFALAVPLLAALWWTTAMTTAAGATEHPAAPAWTARPAANGAGRDGGRPYFYLEGLPGSVLQDRLSVTNPGPDPLTVRLRGADAYNTAKGGFAVRGAHGSTGTGAWLRTAEEKVTVPARTRAEVPVSVTVPQDALPGDHPGAIVAESGGRSVGVRVQLRVGGPTLAALTVEDVKVSGGTIHYTLVNRGNAVLAPRLTVSADGVFGTLLRRDARTLPVELLPGQRVRLTEPWRDTPALGSATVRLRVTAGGGAHSEATASALFVPWLPLTGGALLLLAGAAAGTYAHRRRRAARREGRGSAGTGAAPFPDRQQHSDERHLVKAGAES